MAQVMTVLQSRDTWRAKVAAAVERERNRARTMIAECLP
jgi:hypothetical protein